MTNVHYLQDRPKQDQYHAVDELCLWILKNLHEVIGWKTLTQRSHLSHEELEELFQRRFGSSPMEWIRLQRESLLHSRANLSYECDSLPVAEEVTQALVAGAN